MAEETRSFRIKEETRERISQLAKDVKMTQADFFDSLVNVYEVENAKSMLGDRKKELEEFQMITKRIVGIYLNALELNVNTENEIKEKFSDKLIKKEELLSALQDDIKKTKEELKAKSEEKIIAEKIARELEVKNAQLEEITKAKEELLQEYSEKISTLSGVVTEYKSYKEDIDKVNIELKDSKTKNANYEHAVKDLEIQNSNLNKQISMIDSNLNQYKETLERDRSDYKTEINNIKTDYKKELMQSEQKFKAEKDKIEKDHKEELLKSESRLKIEKDKMEKDFQEKLKFEKDKMQAEIEKNEVLINQYKEALERDRSDYKKEIDSIKINNKEELLKLEQRLKVEKDKMEKDFEEKLKFEKDKMQIEVEKIKLENAKELQKNDQEMHSLRAELSASKARKRTKVEQQT